MESKKTLNLPSVKEGNKVKIALPSLCDYGSDSGEEDEQEQQSKLLINRQAQPGPTVQPASNKSTQQKSSLLNILPPPKANKFISNNNKPAHVSPASQSSTTSIPIKTTSSSLLPRSLTGSSTSAKTASSIDVKNSKLTPEVAAESKRFTTNPFNIPYDLAEDPEPVFEDEDEEEGAEQIAASSSKPGPDRAKLYEEISSSMRRNQEKEEFGDQQEYEEEPSLDEIEPVQTHKMAHLNEEAWKKLCGKKRKIDEPIEIQEVNAKALVGDAQTELLKQMTNEYKPSANRDYFAGSSRKKHQITYLAYVAKERDQELKNMWAQNKFNRMQAKQRYGF